jgi:hypothetical protein
VATKQKEVLAPNLPLAFGVPAVDGYGGGLLPLGRYVTLQRLLLPEGRISIDGRLRENLTAIPDGRWLSLFNVRHVITDKLGDAWIDDVFYDLQFGARLSNRDEAAVGYVPRFEATALGLVSYLEPGTGLADGTSVGVIEVTLADGRERRFALRAGEDVTERSGEQSQYGYLGTRLRWEEPVRPLTISVRAMQPHGTWVVRGLSLIDERTGGFQSLVLSDRGSFRLAHSGDVKVYEHLDVLPRAFIVHHSRMVADDAAALAAMMEPGFDPASEVVVRAGDPLCDASLPDRAAAAEPGGRGVGARVSKASIVAYGPEQVVIRAHLEEPGLLLLTDAMYPGWEATVDGEAAAICRADLLFRAVALDAGEHRVVFAFRSRELLAGAVTSGLGLAVLGAVSAFATGRTGRPAH